MRKRVIVHGRVHGVGFRYAVQRVAATRSVAGWVRNCPDGTVEAVFEGEPAAVDALVRFCHEGPRGAAVERVDVTAEADESADGFEIR